MPAPKGVVSFSVYITASVLLQCMYACVYMEGIIGDSWLHHLSVHLTLLALQDNHFNCPIVPITSCDKVCLQHVFCVIDVAWFNDLWVCMSAWRDLYNMWFVFLFMLHILPYSVYISQDTAATSCMSFCYDDQIYSYYLHIIIQVHHVTFTLDYCPM